MSRAGMHTDRGHKFLGSRREAASLWCDHCRRRRVRSASQEASAGSVQLCQHPCVPTPALPWSRTDREVDNGRGEKYGCLHHADNRGARRGAVGGEGGGVSWVPGGCRLGVAGTCGHGRSGPGRCLGRLADGTVRWTEQQGEISYARKLTAADCWLDVTQGAEVAHNQVRALSPGVGVRAVLGESEVKIWRTWPLGAADPGDVPREGEAVRGRAGEVLSSDGRLFIGCDSGVLEVMELQPACRACMTTKEYLRGYAGSVGTRMKSPPVTQTRGDV